ncbi:MAG: ASCH domain-containing protein [candidate division SR1 bacterium]|nr:ASCH domain-containing protein [candidate division SR1 bacterium]
MDHLAIMNPKRKLIPKILSGEKTIESRRYMMKVAPRNKVNAGDTIYFKDAGKMVTASVEVIKVIQYDNYTDEELHDILNMYAKSIAFSDPLDQVYHRAKPKKYCILMFLKHPKKITPFEIDKTGYGNACAWISLPDIDKIRM